MKKFGSKIAEKYIKFKTTLPQQFTKRDAGFAGGWILVNSTASYYYGKTGEYLLSNDTEGSKILAACGGMSVTSVMTIWGMGLCLHAIGAKSAFLYGFFQGTCAYKGYGDGKHRGKYGLEK